VSALALSVARGSERADEFVEDCCRGGGGVGTETDQGCDERRCFSGGEREGWELSPGIYAVATAWSASDGDRDPRI